MPRIDEVDRGRRPGLPGDHRGLPDGGALGSRRRSSPVPRSSRRRRCSPSWTRQSSTRSWPGWRPSDRPAGSGDGFGPGHGIGRAASAGSRAAAGVGVRQPLPPRHDRYGRWPTRSPRPRPRVSSRVVTVGCDVPSSQWAADCAAEFPSVYAAVAIHPNETAALPTRPADRDAVLAEIAAAGRAAAGPGGR